MTANDHLLPASINGPSHFFKVKNLEFSIIVNSFIKENDTFHFVFFSHNEKSKNNKSIIYYLIKTLRNCDKLFWEIVKKNISSNSTVPYTMKQTKCP